MKLNNKNNRQLAILEFIESEKKSKGYPPSVREIAKAVGLRSSSTVHGYLRKLEDDGYIRRDPTKPRAIEILAEREFDSDKSNLYADSSSYMSIPLVGRVTAGEPILAAESIEDTYPLPTEFCKGNEVFMLRIKGESMIDDGIFDGDYVVVNKQDTAQNGDIVVALLEDEATVKRYYKEENHIRLQPANEHMEPIRTPDVSVLGKVISLIRKVN